MASQFNILQADPQKVSALMEKFNIPHFVAQILVTRGLCEESQVQLFISSSLGRDWRNPYEISGMEELIDQLEEAVRSRRHILVFGDYDVDGISATAVLVRGLRDLGGTAIPFIPSRFEEGYGLTFEAVQRALKIDPEIDVVITVDNGITCKESVKAITNCGIDVLITDHHEPGDLVPERVPVVDPKMDSESESAVLAGAGVAIKVLDALGSRFGKPYLWRDYTDFAALATIADLMPLIKENRALVKDGISKLCKNPRPCLAALIDTAGVAHNTINASNISFSLIPRINAAGRMGSADIAINLFMTDNYEEARAFAAKLEEINDLRRSIEAELSERAMAAAKEIYCGQRVLLVWGQGWHEGVKGIVASRLVNKFGIPVLLFTIEDGLARGSGRSVGRVNLFAAVDSCSDLLIRFGGHEAAVGVTLLAESLPELDRRLCEYMDTLPASDFCPPKDIDAVVSLDELTLENVQKMEILAPFGKGNTTPLLLAQNVFVSNGHTVGVNKNHFSCKLYDGRAELESIMFNCKNIEDLLRTDAIMDAAFQLQIDEWRGRRIVKALLKEINPVDFCVCSEDEMSSEDQEFLSQLYARAKGSQEHTKGLQEQETMGSQEQEKMGSQGQDMGLQEQETMGSQEQETMGSQGQDMGSSSGHGLPKNAIHFQNQKGNSSKDSNLLQGTHNLRNSTLSESSNLFENYVLSRDTTNESTWPGSAEKTSKDKGNESCYKKRKEWEHLAHTSSEELQGKIVEALIGSSALHETQIKALNNLENNISTLCVMATGRGKSLIFQVHAAKIALSKKQASLFVYPLRALIADQEYQIQRSLQSFGVNAVRLTGDSTQEQRKQVYEGLARGDIDIVLTTPEYLCIHANELAAARTFSFVVIDEAHHISAAKAGNRSAYMRIGDAITKFGKPTVLALTATAPQNTVNEIISLLPIQESVFDSSTRNNLMIDDQRNLKNKDEYLVRVVARGEKTIIYVNSREQSVDIARLLRKKIPSLAPLIGFYNAGLDSDERKRVEDLFRCNKMRAIVSTSAFGEGVNIPNIRHVVFYHLPFNQIEFNQMSGRAGRDGKPSEIHLLFGRADKNINKGILADMTPDRSVMAQVYSGLKNLQSSLQQQNIQAFSDELVQALNKGKNIISPQAITCGITVFQELGLINTSVSYKDGKQFYDIFVYDNPLRVELSDSSRYREGLYESELFDTFCSWVLKTTEQVLRNHIVSPIQPDTDSMKSSGQQKKWYLKKKRGSRHKKDTR